MIKFTDRKKLSIEYQEWIDNQPDLKDCPLTLISFLVGRQLLDEEKVLEFLNDIK